MQQSRYKMSLPNCQICNKAYDMYYHIPRVLPKCGHTFCEKCIKSKTANKKNKLTFTCPQCQSDTIIRKNVADQLPKNITIVQLIKDVKFKNLQQNQAQSPLLVTCSKHNKKLQMVCIQCGNVKICSHCAIFGEHKGHNIGNQAGATKQDIQQLQQAINLVQDTVNQILLPNSPLNLQKVAKQKVTFGLQSCIKEHFKHYISQITRRQNQLLQQCESIVFEETAAEYLDNILTSFDILKLKGGDILKDSSRSEVEEVIQTAIQLHSDIQKVKQSFNKSVQTFLQTSKSKIRQVVFFNIQNNERRNLKAILKPHLSPQPKNKQKLGGSKIFESKKQQMITKKSQIKQALQQKNTDTFLSNKIQNKSRIVSTNTNSKSISQKNQSKIIVIQKKQRNERLNVQNQGQIINRKAYSSFVQNEPQIVQNEQVIKIQSKNSKSSVKTQRMKTPPKHNKQRQRSKSPINLIQQADLKFVKPNRQLNYELRPKFQSICDAIDKQPAQGALQLIGMQICDQMIAHICDYLKTKRLKYSMIKLVKNNITDEGFRILMSYLSTDNFTKVLNMTSNHLTHKSLPLITALINQNQNNILKTIYLSNNKVSSMQLKKIQGCLDSKFVQVVL